MNSGDVHPNIYSSCPHVIIVTPNLTQQRVVTKSVCDECAVTGPNLWICLSKDCDLFTGCGEQSDDHSTAHFVANPSHALALNLTTYRVWCYVCQLEVYLERNNPPLSGITTAECPVKNTILSNNVYVADACDNSSSDEGQTASRNDEDVDADDEGDPKKPKARRRGSRAARPKGLTGLQNLGNTCYMNAALQTLSNCPPLTRFMLDCNGFIRKAGLTKSYMRLIKEMWDSRRPSYVAPTGIAHGIKNVCPVFRGYNQHDAQEFLRCFLDQLHEELKQAITVMDNKEFDEVAQRLESVSEGETNSDAEYETCDSGLSSERSACGDDAGGMNDDNCRSFDPLSSNNNTSTPMSKSNKQQSGSSGQKSPSSSESTTNDHGDTASFATTGISSGSPSSFTGSHSSSKKRNVTYKSIISDIFDGKILSSVQCLTCNNVSTTRETFQDLCLPIPNRDHLHMLRAATSTSSLSSSISSNSLNKEAIQENNYSQVNANKLLQSTLQGANANLIPGIYSWLISWFEWALGWFWGPVVSLQDCLSAFFSADELKGDNMYSCEKCRKLRNGIKYSKVIQLPEILCIHLKRIRHELMYSSKISSHVTFPLEGLDMAPYMAKGTKNDAITTYDLVGVICHHGTAASGHYTAYALNVFDDSWYEYDDQYVTSVDPQQVVSSEAYVLFYKKVCDEMYKRRHRALDLMKLSRNEPTLPQYYVSKQWVNRFNTFADPGGITNLDFLCQHGGVDPDRATYVHELCIVFSRSVWEYLHSVFGGGPTCTKLYVCPICNSEKNNPDTKRRHENENSSRSSGSSQKRTLKKKDDSNQIGSY